MTTSCRWLLVFLTLTALAGRAPAGFGFLFGKRGPKPDPVQRVPALIVTLKTEKDESKRAEAAEELRQYNAAAFPDLIPALIDVLRNDPKPAVRAEAAQSLGKMRPVSPAAGFALEQAVDKDASMRVRVQARSALMQYHWAGYRSPKKGEPPQTKEPPLAQPEAAPPSAPARGQAAPALAPAPVRPAKDEGPPLVPPQD